MIMLDQMFIIIPSLFISFFIGFQFLRRLQHRNIRAHLSDSLLELWKINSLSRLIDHTKRSLQKFCSCNNLPLCFVVQSNKSVVDFASKDKLYDQDGIDIYGAEKQYYQLKPSCDAQKRLIDKGYITARDQAYIIHITCEDDDNGTNILFVVYGNAIYIDKSVLETYIAHASACLARIGLTTVSSASADVTINEEQDVSTSCLSATEMQKMLNRYFVKNTSSKSCCFLFMVPDIHQIVCRVVNDNSLDYGVLYPTHKGLFAKVFKSTNPMFISNVELCVVASMALRSVMTIACAQLYDNGASVNVIPFGDDAKYSLSCGQLIYHGLNSVSYLLCTEIVRQDVKQEDKEQLQSLFGAICKSVLCVPISCDDSETILGVVCLARSTLSSYESADVDVVRKKLKRSWMKLSTLHELQEEKEKRQQCETMLKIARNLFTRLGDVGQLLGEVIQEARNLTNAERCSVFLVDKVSNELVAKIFDGIVTADEFLDPNQYDFENMKEVRISLKRGIAGHVATTGKILNIVDAYSHPLFYQGIDHCTGFKTRNILCFPIKDGTGDVVGVAELCNKIKGHCFTSHDEILAERFAVFCGISLSHSLMYKAVEEVGSRNQLANELVTYHMKVDQHDIKANLPKAPIEIGEVDPEFDLFVFRPRDMQNDIKIKACIFMYQDLGLINAYHIPMNVLVHFLLMVRKGYRHPPYHNWDHAFSVMHHTYLLAKNLQLCKKLGDLEVISLLTASVCHDLDHRGTNNAFQINSQSLLANLYSSEGSVLERHHFAQAVCILSTAGCNIFENMKRKEYSDTLAFMKHIILATDVATHLAQMAQFEKMVETGFDTANIDHRNHLLSLCMTASDLSDQTKDWSTTVRTSKLIYKEFFYQGDMEKSMGNSPALINDREKACVPQLQIKFMEHVALPVYRILGNLFSEYEIVHQRVILNVERWRRVEDEFRSLELENNASLDFLTDDFARDLFYGLGEI